MTSSTKRPRRASSEVRELLLAAARDEFLSKGYAGATTKAIASRAEVSETVIFNQFGGKSGLFTTAFVSPFADVVTEYLEARTARSSGAQRVENFVDHLSQLAREYRPILITAISHRLDGTAEDPAEEDLLDHLSAELQKMLGLDEPSTTSSAGPATRASAAAMVLGMALLDDLIFPRGTKRPSQKRLDAEMTTILLGRLRELS